MAIEYNFTLDMDRSKRDNNIAYARTGDVDSITINADLVLNGAAYTPTGTNAFFECVTPNGHSVRAAAEKTGSTVSVEVPSAAFQAAGVINVAYFRFETGEADNPTYVESTEPFAIVVREGIGDDIDAGDYIEEWRGLADKLEAAVAEVEQKAEQAETAINEQKTEVDQLKAQAQVSIAGDVTEVEEAAQSAISAINQEKADVADAAEDVSTAGEQAINTFKTNSQQAINQFSTNADAKLDEVDGMITEAHGDVDAAITQLENKTQDAIEAAQDALDGTTATNLQNAINRTLKLDVADMTAIPDNSSLSSFTNVGSYCCKTAATAATIGDCPVDDSPFNMYVFSSGTSGQVMQLVVPIDLNSKPTAEWHVRFGTSSAMDSWSVIGGGSGGGMPDVVPVSQGGTGATTAAQARVNLGAGTSNFSGDYNDLINKPDIPEPGGSVPDYVLSTVSDEDGRLLKNGSDIVTNISVAESVAEDGVTKLSVSGSTDLNPNAYASSKYVGTRGTNEVKLAAYDPDNVINDRAETELSCKSASGSSFNMSVIRASSFEDYDIVQVLLRQSGSKKRAILSIDNNGVSSVGTSSIQWDDGYFKTLHLQRDLQISEGGTAGSTASQARTNLDAAKGVVTSIHQSLTGSTDVTSSLSSTVHTRFTLDDLLAWLKEQGLGGSQDGMVAGVIYPYTGSTIPDGFLLCDGAAVSRTTYSKLFDAIGTTYGPGDGSTTFNLPNLKQRMLIGSGDGMQTGSTGGSNTHQHEYGVTFGDYYSNIVKPLRTYDYDTSAASDNVVRLGDTPAGTQVNAGTQEGNKNPPVSLPFEFVAYGKTKESDSLPQYLAVNYIISTGDVDVTARFDGFSIEYPISIEKGGTGSTSAKAAQNSLLNDMNVSSDALTDSSMLVGYNASPSASNGAVHKRPVTTIWDYVASKVADKVWEQIKTKAVRSDTTTGADLTLVGGLESMSQTRTSTLTLGINEMSLDNSNAAPFTVNGEEVITEGNISSHLPASFDAKSVWFSTPVKQGANGMLISSEFAVDDLHKYFVPGNLLLANMVIVGDRNVRYSVVVPMQITYGDGGLMTPTGVVYADIADAHFSCVIAVSNEEAAGESTGLPDGTVLLYSVTETGTFTDRTANSELLGFTVFDLVSHKI